MEEIRQEKNRKPKRDRWREQQFPGKGILLWHLKVFLRESMAGGNERMRRIGEGA